MSTGSELAHLFRALKAPAAARALPKLADRARAEQWSYEHFARALLETEVCARDSHGGQARIRQARFPARKTLEEFDFSFQRSVKKTVIEHLGPARFPARQGVHRRVGAARSWFTVHLSAQGVISGPCSRRER
jgi:DNA replication protein DnaC